MPYALIAEIICSDLIAGEGPKPDAAGGTSRTS